MSIWKNGLTPNNVTDLIFTGFKGHPKEMVHSPIIEKYCLGGGSILDFGCGVGRNTNYLKDKYQKVIGYDLPSMLKFYPNNFKSPNITLTSDWEQVKSQRVDEILCSIVLQHIPHKELIKYLIDLSSMSDRIIIFSRTWQDYTHNNTLSILKQYFKIKEYEKYEKNHFIGVFIPKK